MRAMLLSGCPVVGREILATGSPNDWLDQTMSYQLIQTTSFAMHHRLVDYITVALVWMYCSCLLLATDCDVTADFINADPALALLFTTAECDDITVDVIIADSRFLLALCLDPTADSSSCLLIMLTSLLMSSFLIERLILLTSSLLIQLLRFLSSADFIFDGPLRCSSWFPFDVPAGSSSSSSACSWFLSFQLIHFAPAGSTWPPPDYEQLTQLWTSPLLIQLPYTMMN
ncbi:hypothetical protein F511_36281 [Dorcoceras hygrometricum]|uniref:Uncharacterized protein n=1 Tax=Dorcoceras hygrometricum TaxID=472368 RepID=A0A2Z7DHK0_9LAMI|nr:hypothetical protein F511_36281 [Dorcoceras hygrometricum]